MRSHIDREPQTTTVKSSSLTSAVLYGVLFNPPACVCVSTQSCHTGNTLDTCIGCKSAGSCRARMATLGSVGSIVAQHACLPQGTLNGLTIGHFFQSGCTATAGPETCWGGVRAHVCVLTSLSLHQQACTRCSGLARPCAPALPCLAVFLGAGELPRRLVFSCVCAGMVPVAPAVGAVLVCACGPGGRRCGLMCVWYLR